MKARLIACIVAAACLAVVGVQAAEDGAERAARARAMWAQSPHGRMLERILPPAIEPGGLPEPESEGARLTARYCVQCHNLPSPRMHPADHWVRTVERMVWRMRGHGNLGIVMRGLMEGVEAPTDREAEKLTRYLQQFAQKEMPATHPALRTREGTMFSIACSQCHALPDPRQHTAQEWPIVVQRMKRHMQWANTVVGPDELKTTPTLETEQIVRFLQLHSR